MMKQAVRPLIAFTAALAFFPLRADSQTTTAPLFKAKGYFYARYTYIGSTSAATTYSGFLATGSFQVSAFDEKVSLLYRSQHWMSFARTSSSILESPFENRHIVQTAALETNGIGLPGLKLRLGRFFPEFDYASTPVIDGGTASWDGPGFALKAALGRTVDVWNGGEAMLTSLRYASGVRAILSLQYLPDLAHYEETVAYYAKADRVRLVFPSPFFRNMPTPVIVEGMEDGKPFEKQVIASMQEAFKVELLHFAECVNERKTPLTTPEDARGDVALLHQIFKAIKRPLVA
jgi:hypothetical protein